MDYATEMVRVIRERYGLTDQRVLSAVSVVSRHEFVDAPEEEAYSDKPISIGYGQTISQPYTVAFMTHLLVGSSKGKGFRNWKVLEIGTGSGYQAAILSKLVESVYTVEIIPELAGKAIKNLKKLKFTNVHVRVGGGEYGWKEHSPYDAIIITAALEKDIPKELIKQLKVSGIIVAPMGPRNLQTMTRFTKVAENKLEKEEFDKYVFVPFVEEKA